jgi:hypothetical protein
MAMGTGRQAFAFDVGVIHSGLMFAVIELRPFWTSIPLDPARAPIGLSVAAIVAS